MDRNLFWQNSSLPMANERSRSWSFRVMDQCLVWQHSPLLISMSNVGSNHSESWSRVLLGKTSLLIMGVRKVNPDNLDHDQSLVGEHSTLAKAMTNVVWNHLESWVPLGNTLSLLMGMTKVVSIWHHGPQFGLATVHLCKWVWETLFRNIWSHAIEFGLATLPLANGYKNGCSGTFGVMQYRCLNNTPPLLIDL